MLTGHFYYIRDEYFRDFQDEKLMSNKEISQGQAHDRPCFYAFEDKKTGLFGLSLYRHKLKNMKLFTIRK